MIEVYGDGRHSAATSLSCLASLGHLTDAYLATLRSTQVCDLRSQTSDIIRCYTPFRLRRNERCQVS